MHTSIFQVQFFFLLTIFSFFNPAFGQVKLPYINYFDNIKSDTIGWKHYAIIGEDNWTIGIPNGNSLNRSMSAPNVWAASLNTGPAENKIMALETPSFDLSDTAGYYLTFFHTAHKESNQGGNVEYSLDGGNNWKLLNGAKEEKYQWYNSEATYKIDEPGWSFYEPNTFIFSMHSLSFLSGQKSVRFRFKFGGYSSQLEGWIIDNFSIVPKKNNLIATSGQKKVTSSNASKINVTATLVYSTLIPTAFSNTTNYYFSYDTIYDPSDKYLGNNIGPIYRSSEITASLPLPQNLRVGLYYIFHRIDVEDNFKNEYSEKDNWGITELQIDSTYAVPIKFDFESGKQGWDVVGNSTWRLGPGLTHHMEGTHSGGNAWNIYGETEKYLESPYLDYSTSDAMYMISWFINQGESNEIYYSIDDKVTWTRLIILPRSANDEWDFSWFNLNNLPKSRFLKLRVKSSSLVIDDLYIGHNLADLSIEGDKLNRNTIAAFGEDSIKYQLVNSGGTDTDVTTTKFYWSADSLLDAADVLIGSKTEPKVRGGERLWTSFKFSKPTLVSGKYHLIYVLDAGNLVKEAWESNNTGYFVINQNQRYQLPYVNDFETDVDGWRHNASLGKDDWRWTTPNLKILNKALTGKKSWVTNANKVLSPMSRMHLYSPVFDFSEAKDPVIEFDMKLNSYNYEGSTNMNYSVDGGATWTVLDVGKNNSNSRWYLPKEYESEIGLDMDYMVTNTTTLMSTRYENAFVSYSQYNGRDTDRNTRYINHIGFLAGVKKVQFRFNTATLKNESGLLTVQSEGAIVDNFTMREAYIDLQVNVKKNLYITSFSNSIKFFMNVKNAGNFISNASISKFYLSKDTILTSDDLSLGTQNIPSIRPDYSYYINMDFKVQQDLSPFYYLLYELDATKTNLESNEVNNISFWPLQFNGISSYPYLMDFNDTLVDGWHHYIKEGIGAPDSYRFRNIIAPGEALYQTDIKPGQMFTDPIASWLGIRQVPTWYLETPTFDFSGLDNINLSFDLMCIGSPYEDGGNMDYSLDGGNTWTILTNKTGAAYKWYEYMWLDGLNKEPGWAYRPAGYAVAKLDSVNINISFLKGLKNVMFRYKYRSNHEPFGGGTVQGMRIDDFLITGRSVITTAKEASAASSLVMYGNKHTIFIDPKGEEIEKYYTLELRSLLGQTIFKKNIELNPGINEFVLPNDILTGICVIQLHTINGLVKTDKFLVE